MVSIWHLLVFMVFSVGLAGAVVPAAQAKPEPLGWTLAMIAGAAVGFVCLFGAWQSLKAVWKRSQASSEVGNNHVMLAGLCILVWMAASGLLGCWLARLALHLAV
jgi:hypothetical protein